MQDIFSSFDLQRDDILARIAKDLQLDDTRKQRMESAYKSIGALLNEDEGFFKGIELEIYPQGSNPIGAMVKPFHGVEFDLDIVLHIKKSFHYFRPGDIYNALLQKLLSDGRYRHMVKKKRRCVRLEYSGDFHMDILPACIIIEGDQKNLKIPDRDLRTWSDTNPRGFIEWFIDICSKVEVGLLENYYNQLRSEKALIEDLPDDGFYKKKPLQTSLQLIKRYRDIYFQRKLDLSTSSIILTTLSGHFYNSSNSIYLTIDHILRSIRQQISFANTSNSRLKVLNPVNNREDFTEKWDTTTDLYKSFQGFIDDFYSKWQLLQNDFSQSSKIYDQLFGEGFYKTSVKDQLEKFGMHSGNPTVKTGSLILSGNLRTDRRGNINEHEGIRHEKHRDFGNE